MSNRTCSRPSSSISSSTTSTRNGSTGLYVLAFTGMRWCELAGLKWKDIDLETSELRIRRANVKGILGPPKTRMSRRLVGLPEEVTERLKARLARMKAANHPTLARGKDWVFPKEDGELHRGYPMRKALERACKAVGIEFRFTTHGLRRTFNNLARRLVDNMLVLRATVGHASESMTEHYSHIGVDEKKGALRESGRPGPKPALRPATRPIRHPSERPKTKIISRRWQPDSNWRMEVLQDCHRPFHNA